MTYSTGGGGPKEMLKCAVSFCIGCVGYVLIDRKKSQPQIQMIVTKRYNYSADLNIHTTNFPHIVKIINHNIDCLENKGYFVNEYLKITNTPFLNRIAVLEPVDMYLDVSKEKLIRDCKECDVHTEIVYKYDTIFGNIKQSKNKLYWHRCFIDELT